MGRDNGAADKSAPILWSHEFGGKTVLYMLDALICAPSEGASVTADNSRWRQPPFNRDYTSSVFVSQDPVAIDSVGADFLMNEPAVTGRNGALRNNPTVENYLHEAGLVAAAPSGTVYKDRQGKVVSNLGVHEHWNHSTKKQYSRNLGKAEGIELVALNPSKPKAAEKRGGRYRPAFQMAQSFSALQKGALNGTSRIDHRLIQRTDCQFEKPDSPIQIACQHPPQSKRRTGC